VTVEPADPKDATPSRFDPMLRALVDFGLVESVPVEDADGAGQTGRSLWILTPAVQRRLSTLVSPAPPADKLIYFGHRCSSCGEHAPTRLQAGVHVCDACRGPRATEPARRRA
jgi:hypothetical protein